VRGFAFILAGLLAASFLGGPQNPNECAFVTENGNDITIRATSWDPVFNIGRTLADRYGISVSVEAPKWAFPSDTEDVAVADPEFSERHNNIHYKVMKRHTVEVRFSASEIGHPDHVARLLRQVADAANKEMPYGYRLDAIAGDYALVPTKTRDSHGDLEDVLPLLDRKVTIPLGTRLIAEQAKLMADDLSKQTGLHIGCCQALVAGVSWGTAQISFEADNKPARQVLKQLMVAEQKANSESSATHPYYDNWVVRCDGTGAPWCFIEVESRYSARCPYLTMSGKSR